MKSTIKDAYNALTLRNVTIIAFAVVASIVSIDLFGYLIWRRFVTPSIIIAAACIGWSIARHVNQEGLRRIVNATSVGLCGFAIALFIGAFVDALMFPNVGYFAFGIITAMWLWITLHMARALSILRRMPDVRKDLVTESTAVIIAQMTHREERIGEVLDDARRKAATVGVKLAI